MKYCPKCGTENNEEAKFCKSCGTNFEGESSVSTTNTVNNVPQSEGLGTASLVIGIIALVLSFTCFVLFPLFIVIPLALTGLILGIVNKVKKGKKFAGIILNAVAIFVSIVMAILFIVVFAVAVDEEAKKRGVTPSDILNEIQNKLDNYNYVD